MSDITNRLSAAISPVMAAKVYNPMRNEYYLKNNTPKPAESDVKITISDEAKAALTESKDK